MNNEKLLDISWTALLKIAFFVLLLYFIYQIREILVLIVFALVISLLLNPLINFLERKKIPRLLGTIFSYLFVFGLISLFFYLIINFFIQEIQKFLEFLPQYFAKLSPALKEIGFPPVENFEGLIAQVGEEIGKIGANIFNIIFIVFGGIFSAFFVLTLAIFLSLEGKTVGKALAFFFPKKYEQFVLELWENCQRNISAWFATRIMACLCVGILSYFAFFLFDIKYSFSLAFLAGILNFIPFLGPILTGIVIVLFISFESFSKAILALVAFILIQLIESNILTPLLTQKFIGLSPVFVLVSLAIGGQLGGVLGAVLAVPLGGIFFQFLKDFWGKKREETI